MDLKQLQALGAFVPRTLAKREIEVNRPVLKPEAEWEEPGLPEFTGEFVKESISVYLRKRASADLAELLSANDRDKSSIVILRCVCNEDGSELFESAEQVAQMADWLFMPLMMAVSEFNRFGPKPSPSRTSSGAKSRSHSAVAASRNGSKRSPKKSARSGLNTDASAAP